MARKGESKGQVDLNTAGREDLMRIEGIDGERARLILDHRSKHGGFSSWEEFEEVIGIGSTLMKKAREAGTLGAGGAKRASAHSGGSASSHAGSSKTERSASSGAGEASGEVAELDEVEVMTSMAKLDLEAALAYDVCASAAESADVRKHLSKYRDDHHHHVDAINAVLKKRGGKPVERSEASELLANLARVAAEIGTDAALLALLANEELTNTTYSMSLELEWDDEVQAILERHAADEERHYEWIADQIEELGEQEEMTELHV